MPKVWPATIPAPTNAFELEQLDVSARTGDQFGVKTTRRRMTNAPANLSLKFVLTLAEKTALDTLFYTTCNNGSYWFTSDWLAHALSSHHLVRIIGFDSVVLGKGSAMLLFSISMDCEVVDKGSTVDAYLHPWHDKEGV